MAASASILETSGSPGKTIADVPVYPEVKVSYPAGQSPKLFLTGAGLRVKKIAILKIKAYVAASYIDSTTPLPAAHPMDGIKAAKTKALRLTFLRDINSDKIRNSFKESLSANKVDIESPAIKQLFEKLDFDVKEKSTLDFVGYKAGAQQGVAFEGPKGKFSVEGPDLADNFWKIWFGNTSEDGGLESLKEELAPKS